MFRNSVNDIRHEHTCKKTAGDPSMKQSTTVLGKQETSYYITSKIEHRSASVLHNDHCKLDKFFHMLFKLLMASISSNINDNSRIVVRRAVKFHIHAQDSDSHFLGSHWQVEKEDNRNLTFVVHEEGPKGSVIVLH